MNKKGHRYFIELSGNPETEKERCWCDFSVDLDLQEIREKEYEEAYIKREKDKGFYPINRKQDYYNTFNLEKDFIDIAYSLDSICDFINNKFGCNYKRAGIIRYLISPDDYINKC